MALTPTNIYNNPATPGIAAEMFIPDQLIAGPAQLVTRNITVLSGAGVLPRGTVMGRISVGSASSAAKSGGNTGNGTCTAVSSKGNAAAGVYTARVVISGTNSATWNLSDPQGKLIDQKQYSGSGGTAVFSNDQLAFTITDGSTDFATGDGFDITVAAGSGKWIKSVATASDGSQVPQGILVDVVDATSADANGGAYISGEFNGNALTYDASWSVATLQLAMRAYAIWIHTMSGALSNADPT